MRLPFECDESSLLVDGNDFRIAENRTKDHDCSGVRDRETFVLGSVTREKIIRTWTVM